MVLAVDGEALPGVRSAEFSVQRGALTYYSPRPEPRADPSGSSRDYPDSTLNHP